MPIASVHARVTTWKCFSRGGVILSPKIDVNPGVLYASSEMLTQGEHHKTYKHTCRHLSSCIQRFLLFINAKSPLNHGRVIQGLEGEVSLHKCFAALYTVSFHVSPLWCLFILALSSCLTSHLIQLSNQAVDIHLLGVVPFLYTSTGSQDYSDATFILYHT